MEITSANKTALLFGASGLVGTALLQELLQNPTYVKVIAPSRRPLHQRHERLENPQLDFEELEKWSGRLTADDVFIALGTTIKTAGSKEAFRKVDFDYIVESARVAQAGGAKQCLLVSSAGADPESRLFYSRVKGETEAAIKDLGFWATHIFRPGALVGDREEFRLGEKIGIAVTNALRSISPNILGDYNPTEVDVLAKKMVQAAQGVTGGVEVYGARELL